MRGRYPFTVLMLCWLVFVCIVVAADCLLKPAPVTLTEAPTRVPLTVLPTQTPFVFMTAIPTITPMESLPMVKSTRVPTSTFTPIPATATPTTNPTPPVQRG